VEQQNKERQKQLKKQAAPRTSQQTIKYLKMFEDGICQVEYGLYSKTFKISDINYQIARREEQVDIFTRYCEVLNYCDPAMFLQITIINRRIDRDDFQRNMFSTLVGDNLDEYRKEMNTMLGDRALEGQNSILREKYITFSSSASTYQTAIPTLARLETDLIGLFKSLGCEVVTLNGLERLELIHTINNPDSRFDWTYDNLVFNGLTTKSAVAPSSFNFKDSKSMFEIGENLGQVLFLKDLPADLSDNLISALSDLPIDMTITLHIQSVEQDKAFALVKQKISFMEQQKIDEQKKALKAGYDTEMIPYELRYSLNEAQELLDDLQNKNQRMFKVTMLIYTFANDLDVLNENVYQILAAARKKNCKIERLDYLQEEGINSTYPLGKNHIEIQRTLTTASTAIFIPFTTQEIFQQGGMYYGQNALSRNLIFFDRKTLKAPNGVILGTPGSGKSFAAKREMINVLLNDENSEVLIIDPEREYLPLAYGFDGEIINISAASKDYINPMDITMDYADDEEPLLLKSDFVLTICELLIGGKMGLTAAQRSIISRACMIAYQPYFANSKKNPMPTLVDFYETIKAQPETIAQSIALDLELFIEGALSVFANRTNVDTTKRLVVFDIRDLGKQLRTFGMLVVMDQIWNRITMNRAVGKRTWIYIDEIQLLFQNEFSANYFFELWSRARKWGAIPTGITQNVETLLLSDLARRMLSNSDFIMMLNQATSDRVELAGLLNISPQQLGYVTNSEAGHGLLFAGKAIVPFVDKFPKTTRLYQMMTTKIEEVTSSINKNEEGQELKNQAAV